MVGSLVMGFVASTLLAQGAPQAPGEPKAREVSRIYWELQQTTEVRVQLIPATPEGKPLRVNLVFRAFFPGRETREWHSGRPQWPTGPPARITVTAQALPLTAVIPELSLRLIVDGARVDLTPPGGNYHNIPCLITTEDCAPDGVEVDLEPTILASLVSARSVEGHALGFPFRLAPADLDALHAFAARISLPR